MSENTKTPHSDVRAAPHRQHMWSHVRQRSRRNIVVTTPAVIDAYETLGTVAPECGECEGTGMVTYFHGPYERERECDRCHGLGRHLPCPHCTDGTQPDTGGTCATCDGYASPW
ncbi:hypothetical protein [Streptomyces regalis]|uniref:hypothetical protein n=1 Tax=Streptomyces regalis TaxID=68262 RepID=UPI000A993A0C|nr:hypothetical protein [Streptomyces regalis]